MLVKVFGAAVQGIDALVVTIEVNCSQGIRFFMVGLPDAAVKESHERIVSAVEHNGYRFPRKQVIVNMSPADIRKEGAAGLFPSRVKFHWHTTGCFFSTSCPSFHVKSSK